MKTWKDMMIPLLVVGRIVRVSRKVEGDHRVVMMGMKMRINKVEVGLVENGAIGPSPVLKGVSSHVFLLGWQTSPIRLERLPQLTEDWVGGKSPRVLEVWTGWSEKDKYVTGTRHGYYL